jgi:hypothetical protein
MKPEDIERLLVDDSVGVAASPGFAAGVMAAVRREIETPPPIPFPWKRAWPGIAAVLVALPVTWVVALRDEGSSGTAVADGVVRSIEVVGRIGGALASVDPVLLTIGIVVAALTLLPIAVPFWVVSAARDS